MLFAEAGETWWQTVIVALAGALLAYVQWKTKASVEQIGKKATEAADSALAATEAAKDALTLSDNTTAEKLAEVKTEVTRRSEKTTQIGNDVQAVKNGLTANTNLTAEVKNMVNDQHSAILTQMEALRAEIAALKAATSKPDGSNQDERGQ